MKKPATTDTPKIGRYIDPLTDFGFKKIFGSEPNKDLLIAFLNELLKGSKVIRNLLYNQQELNGPATYYRKSIFDLTCTGDNGETFIIEVQRAEQKFFKDRALFYTASKLYEQGQKGKEGWDFELQEMYFIAVMDFNFDDTPKEKYLHKIGLADENGRIFYNKLELIFLELPNFNVAENAIKTDLERWFYVLRNMDKFEKVPVILHKRIFQQLFQIAEVANLKKEEYMLYERALLDRWTENSIRAAARDRQINALKLGRAEGLKLGKAEGKIEGKAEGRIEGKAEGKIEGKAEGRDEAKTEDIRNLIIKLALTNEQIADITGVTVAFVKKIRTSLKKKK